MRNHKIHTESPFLDGGLILDIDTLRLVASLSKTAFKLFIYIKEASYREGGVIYFDKYEAKSYCGFKQDKSIYNALNELVNIYVLAGKKEPNEFFYNPIYIKNSKE